MKFLYKSAFVLILISPFFLNCSSNSEQKISNPPEPVYFSKNWKAELDIPISSNLTLYRKQNGALSAIFQTPEKILLAESADNGLSWSSPKELYLKKSENENVSLIIKNNILFGLLTHHLLSNGGQLYFYPFKNNKSLKPGAIRDTNWGKFSASDIVVDSAGTFYCVFIDWRNGNADLYLSSSVDSGKTWSKNIRIDDDLSGQEQIYCRLLTTKDGILYAIWQDNRNLKTLYDIYFSKSYDGGKTWSKNIRINDDTTHTWQEVPFAALDKNGSIYVNWHDFRKKGSSGEIVPNIYFSSSSDQGNTWSPNIPITHEKQYGTTWAQLVQLSDCSLHCVWGEPHEGPVTQLFHSYSKNQGKSWSEPALINDDFSNSHHDYRMVTFLPDENNDLFVAWIDFREKIPNLFLAKLQYTPDKSRMYSIDKTDDIKASEKSTIKFETVDTLFVDHFEKEKSNLWKEISGIWVLNDNMYIGFNQGMSIIDQDISLAFSFSGRFLLDPLNHRVAHVYFQVVNKSSTLNYLRVSNLFRSLVRLDYYDGQTYQFITDWPYKFQKNQWYTFKLIVKDKQLNYFINDSLLISHDLWHPHSGKVGIGTDEPPTYYKDMVVTRIR